MEDVLSQLKERIKQHEGYSETVYEDTLGFKTGGYGHKIIPGEDVPTTREGWETLFEQDFQRAVDGCNNILNNYDVDQTARDVVTEMCFQMGEAGVSKFKRALSHLYKKEYKLCSQEMMNSRWAIQTPNRAKALSDIMGSINA
jgi:lysozyme